MGVAVLNPHDCLKNQSFSRQPLISPPRSKPAATRNPNRAVRAGPNNRRRPRPTNQSPPPARSTAPATGQKSLVNGQIRILKRGENVTPDVSKENIEPGMDLGTTGLLGPVPNRVQIYAGSAFFTSPPPSSVPLPAFFTRKTTDDATSGLRRLLRLDL